MPMDVCHILLERPCKYDRGAMHDGMINIYKFLHDGIDHSFLPMKEGRTSKVHTLKLKILSNEWEIISRAN